MLHSFGPARHRWAQCANRAVARNSALPQFQMDLLEDQPRDPTRGSTYTMGVPLRAPLRVPLRAPIGVFWK